MTLTPLDVEKIAFRTTFRGYAREEVEEFLTRVADALSQQASEIHKLTEQLNAMERELERYRDNEELLKSSVVLAQKTCDELIGAAHKQADVIKREAESEGADIRRRLSELRSEREQFEFAFHGLLRGFTQRLESNNPQLAAGSAAEAPEPAAEPVEPPAATFDAVIEEQAKPVPPQPASREPFATPPIAEEVPKPTMPSAPAGATEFDRDADADEFSAALNSAEAPSQAAWPPDDAKAAATEELTVEPADDVPPAAKPGELTD